MIQPNRRDLLKAAAPLAALPFITRPVSAQGPTVPGSTSPAFPGMIVRMRSPRNLETPVQGLIDPNATGAAALQTPNNQFYVRSHFAVPKLDEASFQLTVEGAVEKPLTLSLADLKKLKTVTKDIALECAGNGRIFLAPQVRGLQWGFGGVGNATWEGVPLSAVLDLAKPKRGAVEVIFVAADKGAIKSDPSSPGEVHYDRSIPYEKATKPETLLAWGMNGKALPAEHGYPLRAVVGGWYGMAAVKWLTKIIVTDTPYNSFWQTFDYSYFQRVDGMPTLSPVTAIQPKAIITSLSENTKVQAGATVTVTGLAWAGEASVSTVEFSADGGTTWQPSGEFKNTEFTWAKWSCTWTPKQPGTAKLVARCTDTTGRTQPTDRDDDRRTYMINHLVPIDVLVQ